MTQIPLLTKILAFSLIGTLAGCATVDTKTIVSNSDTYLANHFTPANLTTSVRTAVEAGEQLPKLFNRIQYRMTADLDDDGKVSQITSAGTLINIGNGYIQDKVEYSRNGVPYRINLMLTFAGLYQLRNQTTFVDRPNALIPVDTKEILKFDRALGKPQAGQTYTIATKNALESQLMNFKDQKQICTAGQPVPAASAHASLPGTGVPLDCTLTGDNGMVTGKLKMFWISDLGVAFRTEYSDARSTARYKLESLNIQP